MRYTTRYAAAKAAFFLAGMLLCAALACYFALKGAA